MKLVEVRLENFRGVNELTLPIDELTVLIGENNTGKTTVIEAVRMALTRSFSAQRSQFAEYDFHLTDANASPQTAPPIKITLHFAEKNENEWSDTVIQQMDKALQTDSTGLYHLYYQVKCVFNPTLLTYETECNFLDLNGLVLSNVGPATRNMLYRFAPLFFLSAVRDASQEFGQRGQFWGGFLKSAQLADDQKEKIELVLEQINTELLNSNEGLKEVAQRITEAKRLVPLDTETPVVLEAIPTRIFDMVGKIQIHLKTIMGAKLPLNKHGEGTKNLAVLMLFQAFTNVNLKETYTPDSEPILALEEPEAHLHPSAVRSLGTFLENMFGQILITSHSGDFITRVPITSLRRLYKKNGNTMVGRINTTDFEDNEKRLLDYHIIATKGYHLFARCWLLVEGQSEFWLFPRIAELMDVGLDEKNFAVVEYSQGGGPRPYIKMAQALGIEWFVVADGDPAGTDFINIAKLFLNDGEAESDRMHQLRNKNLEHLFWSEGFENVFVNAISSTQFNRIKTDNQNNPEAVADKVICAAVNNRKKPGLSMDLSFEIETRGADSIPLEIRRIVEQVSRLSGG